MAKFCVKCGKALPDGIEICSECNVATQENEAALFTRMTSETEVWKTAEPVKKTRVKKVRVKAPRSSRKNIAIFSAAGAVVVLVVVLVLLSQPANRVVRAIRNDDIDRAQEIFWNSTSLTEGGSVPMIDKALLEAAQTICAQYANHEIDGDSAAQKLSKLGTFGSGAATLLEDTYAEFRSYSSSQQHMESAENKVKNGDYLEARKEFLLVIPADADYADAQAKAEECLVLYGKGVGADADALMAEHDYRGAITLLREGNDILYGFDTFSEVIDDKLLECYAEYEDYLVIEAENLAELKDYDAAATLIRDSIVDFGTHETQLKQKLEEYESLAFDKLLSDACERADAFYAEGAYAEAFAELEGVKEMLEVRTEEIDEAVEALEARFAEDMCAEAEAVFAGERDNLEDAIAGLDAALEIRELDDIQVCRDHLAEFLPLSLVTAEYADKEGILFRNTGSFESLDGSTIEKGWLWGENGAEITFALDEAYDLFTCSFAVRRDDNAAASGYFEVWLDGERVYKAERLHHFQKEVRTAELEVTGCKELKIVISCDYNASTTENGYCYHGICNPIVTKNLESAAPAAE